MGLFVFLVFSYFYLTILILTLVSNCDFRFKGLLGLFVSLFIVLAIVYLVCNSGCLNTHPNLITEFHYR